MNQGLSWRAAQAGANSEVFTNHETRPFLARCASQREIQGFHEKLKTKNKKLKTGFEVFTKHESRNTKHGFYAFHQSRPFFSVGAQGTRNRKPPPGRPFPPPGRCFPARCGAAWRGHGRHIAPRAGALAPSAVLAQPQDARRSLGIPAKCTKSRFRQENASSAALAAVPVALRAASESAAMEGTRGGPRPTTGGTRRAYKKISRCASLHVSPRGEAKCVRGPSGRGVRRLARAGVLEPYVEHGKQAQRSPGGHTACFDRRVVRLAG